MKKIYLITGMWTTGIVCGLLASVFNNGGTVGMLFFLCVIFIFGAFIATGAFIAENWDNWQ